VAKLDRYVLSQMLTLFGFFALVLAGVYWINRAVVLFDRLISDGHSAAIFVELSLLSLPNVIRLVLPVAAFAASVYVINRMRGESELVIIQSAGMSPLRVARPVLVFGAIAMALTLALSHVVSPVSKSRLDDRTAELARDVTAGLLSDGQFLHPADGVTLFITRITEEGELRGLFLSDRRGSDDETTYVAERALLLDRPEGPQLVMFDGLAQSLGADRRLGVTRFDNFAFDVSKLVPESGDRRRGVDEVSTFEIAASAGRIAAETGESARRIAIELGERTVQGVQSLLAPYLGVAVMLTAGFSRFSAWRQILAAIVMIILYDLSDNLVMDMALGGSVPPGAVYLPSALLFLLATLLLHLSGRPSRRRRVRAAP
jgi:lipopolysaccharide export system permease protein